DLGARKQRRDDFKGRILGGRADEDNVAGFDVREKSVLLGFVEAVNLVNENDGAMAGTRFVLGDGHDFLKFFDAGQDRAEGNEFGASQPGDQASQSGLPAAGRAPEEQGAKVVAFG